MNKNGLLNTVQVEEQVTPKMEKQEASLLLHFWRHLTHAYNTVHESLNKKSYLTFINGSK